MSSRSLQLRLAFELKALLRFQCSFVVRPSVSSQFIPAVQREKLCRFFRTFYFYAAMVPRICQQILHPIQNILSVNNPPTSQAHAQMEKVQPSLAQSMDIKLSC